MAVATARPAETLLDALLYDWGAAAELLGFGIPEPWQRDVLNTLAAGEPFVAVSGCHGPGKTWLSAVAAVCGLLHVPRSRVILTAPKEEQVLDGSWGEIAKVLETSPALRHLLIQGHRRLAVRGAEKTWWAGVRVAKRPGKRSAERVAVGLHGHHAPYVLVVIEESSGVPDSVLGAVLGALATGHGQILAIGNPTRATGWFADAVTGRDPRWKRWVIGYKDSARVNRDWAETMIRRYGLDHPWVRSKVLGVPPLDDSSALLTLDVIEAAMAAEPRTEGLRAMGFDPARFGGSHCAAALAVGSSVVELTNLGARDADTLAGAAVEQARRWNVDLVVVDCDGYGAAVFDVMRAELRRRGVALRLMEWRGSGAAPTKPRTYVNARAELHVEVAAALRRGEATFPRNEDLAAQALEVHVEVRENDGRLVIEDKDAIAARLGRSPDEWDAALMALAPSVLRLGAGVTGSIAAAAPRRRPVV